MKHKQTAYLFSEKQLYPLKHLVAKQRSDGHIKEESVQYGGGDVGQYWQEQQGQADQDVRQDTGHTCLSYFDYTEEGAREREREFLPRIVKCYIV